MKIGAISLGCDKNRVDTEKMLSRLVQVALAERGVVNAGVVQNPVCMGAQILNLSNICNVNAEGCRAYAAFKPFQGVHEVKAFLVGQGACGIDYAGEFHLSVAKNFVCLANVIAACRALVFSAGVNGGRAFRADGHRFIYSWFFYPGEDLLLSWSGELPNEQAFPLR